MARHNRHRRRRRQKRLALLRQLLRAQEVRNGARGFDFESLSRRALVEHAKAFLARPLETASRDVAIRSIGLTSLHTALMLADDMRRMSLHALVNELS